MGACHRFAGGFAGAQPRLAKIAQYIAIFRLIAVAPYLNLLSVRRGWAIGSPVIVDETIGMWLGFSLPGCCSGFAPLLASFSNC